MDAGTEQTWSKLAYIAHLWINLICTDETWSKIAYTGNLQVLYKIHKYIACITKPQLSVWSVTLALLSFRYLTHVGFTQLKKENKCQFQIHQWYVTKTPKKHMLFFLS